MKKIKIISCCILILALMATLSLSAFAEKPSEPSILAPRRSANNDEYVLFINHVTYRVPYNTVLVYGSTGYYVEVAQRALNNVKSRFGLSYETLPVTQNYLNMCVTATSAFQQWWNDNLEYFYGSEIAVDGKVGNDTWRRFQTVCM